MMRVVIRVDASEVMGSGHVMRCLALAGELRERKTDVAFVCREHPGNLCLLIEQQGFIVFRLPVASFIIGTDDALAHAHWLGATWQDDADRTRAVIAGLLVMPDWLVVDHYGVDFRWENALRTAVGDIMAIDDLADRMHSAGLLLDQNLVERMGDRYADKIPIGTGLLLGPCYALLQPSYAGLHDRMPVRQGPIRRILLYFGGADAHDLTGRALAAFLQLDRNDVVVDVVVPASSPNTEGIRRLAEGKANVHLHGYLPSLAELMARADLAIGAAGIVSWERLCLGLPALVVTVAENQRAIAEELERCGLIRYLGHHDGVDESAIETALAGLLGQRSSEEWSRRCLMAVDGRGAARVGAVLTTTAETPLQVRDAAPWDEALLLEWANDPMTRRNAFSSGEISTQTHQAWFKARLGDRDGCRLYIVETPDGAPLGTVRFERQERAWEVHFSLAPVFRRRGLGRRLLQAAMLQLRADNMGDVLVFGQVKESNLASSRIFETLAFQIQPQARAGIVVFQRAL